MPNNVVGLTLGEGVDLYVAAIGGKLVLTPDGDSAVVLSVQPADPEPEPPLPPGTLVFNEGFETFPQGWTQDPLPDPVSDPPVILMFERGNTRTHGEPTPPEMGQSSLRMKLGNCIKPAGCFPPNSGASVSRPISLPPGRYRVMAWFVQHEAGLMRLFLDDREVLATEDLNAAGVDETAWRDVSKVVDLPRGAESLEFRYDSPAAGEPSGTKCALLTIETWE